MNKISKCLIALALLSAPVLGNAALVRGTLSGSVYAAQGIQNGVDLSTLIGLPLSGTFSFDSQSLPLTSGGAGTCCSNFVATNPATPVVISVTVGGNTFTVAGASVSTLTISNGAVSTFFSLQVNNGPHDQINFGLTNLGNTPFLLNGNDAGSTHFTFSAPAGSQQGVGQANFNDASTGPGSAALLTFSITSASAGAASLPEDLLAALLKEVSGIAPEGLANEIKHAQHHLDTSCSELTEFVEKVRRQEQKNFDPSLATKLVADAQAIETALGCISTERGRQSERE